MRKKYILKKKNEKYELENILILVEHSHINIQGMEIGCLLDKSKLLNFM